MAHKIGPECIGCGACAGGCPTGCIHEDGGVYVINAAECIDCGTCAGNCPTGASIAYQARSIRGSSYQIGGETDIPSGYLT